MPPCILPAEDGTSQVALEVDDMRAPQALLSLQGLKAV